MYPDFRLPVHMKEGKTEEFSQPGSTDLAFLLVHLKSEFDGQEPRDTHVHPLGRLAAFAIDSESSSPREPPPQALTEPDVNVSAHPAPIDQPMHRAISNGQTNLAVFVQSVPAIDSPFFDVL